MPFTLNTPEDRRALIDALQARGIEAFGQYTEVQALYNGDQDVYACPLQEVYGTALPNIVLINARCTPPRPAKLVDTLETATTEFARLFGQMECGEPEKYLLPSEKKASDAE